jgi:hypothetical protein
MAKDSAFAAPGFGRARRQAEEKKKMPRGSAQAIEKARSRQENQRKSNTFPLIFFAQA